MSQLAKDSLASLGGTNASVSQSLKSRTTFLIINIVFAGIFLAHISKVFTLEYSDSRSVNWLTFNDKHEPYTVSTDQLVPAIRMIDFSQSGKNLTQYMVPFIAIQFKIKNKEGKFNFKSELRQAAFCKDVYPQDQYPSVQSQFLSQDPDWSSRTEWYCMQPGTFELLNDAGVQSIAVNPSLNFGYCHVMGKALNLDTSGCVIDQNELKKIMRSSQIESKIVEQYFNVEHYYTSGKLAYRADSSLVSMFDYLNERTVQMNWQVEKYTTNYWSGRYISGSSFQWLFTPITEIWYKAVFKQSYIFPSNDNAFQFGLYSLSLSQNYKQTSEDYQLYTLDDSFGFQGGYQGLLFPLVIFASYQDLFYQKILGEEPSQKASEVCDQESGESGVKMIKAIKNRTPYAQNSALHRNQMWIQYLCCCCKKKAWNRSLIDKKMRNYAIEEGLQSQIDVEEIIKWLSIFKLVSKLNLKKTKTQLINELQASQLQKRKSNLIEDLLREVSGDVQIQEYWKTISTDVHQHYDTLPGLLDGNKVDSAADTWVSDDQDAEKELESAQNFQDDIKEGCVRRRGKVAKKLTNSFTDDYSTTPSKSKSQPDKGTLKYLSP